MDTETTQKFIPDARSANASLELYIAQDFAQRSGLSFAEMSPEGQRRWRNNAQTAVVAVSDWIANNAAEAVAPLREAGLMIWTATDGFGRCDACGADAGEPCAPLCLSRAE